MIDEPRGPRDPLDAWRRIKEVRHLRGVDLATAQGIAAWREDRARVLDLTPRFVLADLGVVGLAVARPTSEEQLKDVRGIDARSLRNVASELLEVIAASAANPARREPGVANGELSAALRPALPLVSAWVTQLSRELHIEPAMLATRTDLEAFLRGDDDARLARGWRAELVGEPVRRLVDGEVALAFDRRTGLHIEERAGRGTTS
jgi:ribonuclease D